MPKVAQPPQSQPQAQPSDMLAQAIHQAKELEYERGKLMERTDANRRLLRLLDENKMIDEPTGKWLDLFYPTKERGSTRSKEEVEATRQAKVDARKEIATERGEDVPDTPVPEAESDGDGENGDDE